MTDEHDVRDIAGLVATDEVSAAGATAPRVDIDSMQAKIVTEEYGLIDGLLTICILKMRNGFYVVGHSAAASPENFDPVKGQRFAKENAIRQLWPMEGYLLREQLWAQAELESRIEQRLAEDAAEFAADMAAQKSLDA